MPKNQSGWRAGPKTIKVDYGKSKCMGRVARKSQHRPRKSKWVSGVARKNQNIQTCGSVNRTMSASIRDYVHLVHTTPISPISGARSTHCTFTPIFGERLVCAYFRFEALVTSISGSGREQPLYPSISPIFRHIPPYPAVGRPDPIATRGAQRDRRTHQSPCGVSLDIVRDIYPLSFTIYSG